MSNELDPVFRPIIYVRGYAATMSEIEDTTADPYMGFNKGSTMLRQRAESRDVTRFIFESPLIRLMKDHGYEDAFNNGAEQYEPGTAPPRSVWVFRYYERVSDSLGSGKRVDMEQFAVDLRMFILMVRDAICGDDAQRKKKFGVYLVAHSMGGLVCRCYLQNICRHGTAKWDTGDHGSELKAGSAANRSYVEKVFTYGTPHNGIEFVGLNVPNLGPLDRLQIANFDRDRIRKYLKLPGNSGKVNGLDGAFDPQRFFCFIGSNHKDYDAFAGLSKRFTGPMSDGLVMMENAYVDQAPRAVTHRAHSGSFGLVNSESGYQNLRRFLFGDLRVTATLQVDELTLPKSVQAKYDAGATVRGSYHFDVATQVRGAANYFLNERRYEQGSAIYEGFDRLVKQHKSLYLFTGYLLEDARRARDHALMFSIDLKVRVPAFEIDKKFWFDEHFEGFLYEETISFAVRQGSIRYGLRSLHGFAEAPVALPEESAQDGTRTIELALETPAGLRPGFRGRLQLLVEPWQHGP